MPTLYVKKIWSLHPTLYKHIPLAKAMKGYKDYVQNILYIVITPKMYGHGEKHTIKSFAEWLKTEI